MQRALGLHTRLHIAPFHENFAQEACVVEDYDNVNSQLMTIFANLTPQNWAMCPVVIVRRGFDRPLLLLLLFLAATSVSDAYICRYNCSNVNNIYCRTKDFVCPYPDGDDLAMERANMLLAKSTTKSCTRAMKLFICHLWFPKCEKAGAVGNVNPVRLSECLCEIAHSRLDPPTLSCSFPPSCSCKSLLSH